MGIKTNELQKVASVLGTDSIVADTDTNGTARVPFNVATEFYKESFMCGGIPYGKELTESWANLQARIKAGNFKGIHIGDFKTITLTTGEKVVMEVAGIDHYYKCGDTTIGHHVDFISRDCLAGTKQFNTTDTNNGTEAEPNPWRASALFATLNNTVYATLPEDLKNCIIQKRFLLDSRYSKAGALSEANSWAWGDMGKLWIPTETEVWGTTHWSQPGYGNGIDRQYPIFVGNSKHLIKGAGNGGGRCTWWEASARQGSSSHFCCVRGNGYADGLVASNTSIYAPLCFRIG